MKLKSTKQRPGPQQKRQLVVNPKAPDKEDTSFACQLDTLNACLKATKADVGQSGHAGTRVNKFA